MEPIIGRELSIKFFNKPTNASSKTIRHVDGFGSDADKPLGLLRDELAQKGFLKIDLIDVELKMLLESYYSKDYELIKVIKSSEQT